MAQKTVAAEPRQYLIDDERLVFVSDGISGGSWWGSFYRKPNGSLKRLTSKKLPMRRKKELAQADLDRWAKTEGFPEVR